MIVNTEDEAKRRLGSVGFLDLCVDPDLDLVAEIDALKKSKNAIILAHFYQKPEIQDLADHVGDSLGLSKIAAQTDASIILFAGVHFMAETAKILNPEKKVLLPDLNAGCSLASSCEPKDFKKFVDEHPDHCVISYINCSAEVKTLSDIICTSANAVDVINSVPKDQPIIFAPDKNLGMYLQKVTGREMLLWDGVCVVHEAFSLDKIMKLQVEYPDAELIAHPESEPELLNAASFIGSTSAMIRHITQSEHDSFIIATEVGILHEMTKVVPHKTLIPAPAAENNTCACSECAYMKLNTLKKLYLALKYEMPEITLSEKTIHDARLPLQRMMEVKVLA